MPPVLARVLRPRRPLRAALLAAVAVAAACAPTAQAAEQRVLILGDSIAQGTAGDVTWRARLWQSLQEAPGGTEQVDFIGSTSALFNVALNRQDDNHLYAEPAFDQDHESVWGTTLATVVPLLPAKLAALPQPPTTVVVALGTNDAPAGTAKALGLMRRLIATVRGAAPGADVVMQVPYMPVNPNTGAGLNISYTQSFAAGLATIASELDTPSERVVVAPVSAFDARVHTWDGHHPNAAGEVVLARTTASALAEVGVGDGPHLPDSAVWPVKGPTPIITYGGGRATITWKDTSPGALAYALEQRHTTASGQIGPWTLMTQPSRTVGSWTSAPLTTGDVYIWRLIPVRGLMRGQPGSTLGGFAPAPVATGGRKPWWQFW